MEAEIFVNAINLLQKEYKEETKEKQQQQQDKYTTNVTEQISITNTDNEIQDLKNSVNEIKTEMNDLQNGVKEVNHKLQNGIKALNNDLQNSVKELNNKLQDLEFCIKQFIEMLSTPSYEEDGEDEDEYEGEDTCDL